MPVRLLQTSDPNYTNAKNTRIVHLSASKEGVPITLEATASNKARLPKSELSAFTPDNLVKLDASQLRVLQDWLAARYRRAAFPDKLNDLLSRVDKTFEKVGKSAPAAILDIFIDYEPDDRDLQAGERYEVTIYIVYSTDVPAAKETAEGAASRLLQRFEGQFKKDGTWAEVELVDCRAVSEAEFTYWEVNRMKRYKLDYVSLKASVAVDPADE